MLYWLVDLSDKLSVLNVFRYITFRTGGAVITALLFVFLFGQNIIDRLRLLQGKGQPIRADGPKTHIIAKAGTPTMGGLMILSGMLVSTLLWANPTNPYVWVVLWVMLGFGLVGFYDDYLKVTKQSHDGIRARTRLIIEACIAGLACWHDGWLEQLYVDPAHHNKGAGTELLERVMREHGQGFQLWTFQANAGARRFYERHGFVLVELTDGTLNEEKTPDARYEWRPR